MSKISVESIIPDIQVILKERASFLSRFLDVSARRVAGSDVVSYPTKAGVTVQNIGLTASFTDSNASYSKDSLTLDKKLGRSFTIINPEEDQNLLNTLELHSLDISEEIINSAQALVVASLQAGTAAAGREVTRVENTDGSVQWYKTILKARAQLKKDKVPTSNLVLLVGPDEEAEILNDEKIVRADARDGSTDRIGSGFLGSVAGVEIFCSTHMQGQEPILAHRNALAYAWQYSAPVMESNPDAKATGEVFAVYNVFGLNTLQDGGSNNACPFAVRIVDDEALPETP
jgi:hypothetical protein